MKRNQMKQRFRFNPPQVLVAGFALIIVIGASLLRLPMATEDGLGMDWLDAFFTATSATCVTGLVVVDTGTTFSLFGELVILTLIQIGGLGFMTFATLYALFLGKRISLKERLLLQQSLNQVSMEGIVRLVQLLLIFTAICEVVGGLLLAARFAYDMPVAQALYYGIFHAISNFNNAGFDLMGEFRSFTGYVTDPMMNIVLYALIVLGGLGFMVMAELYDYRYRHRLSMHTKVVLATTGSLIALGTVVIFLLEFSNPKTLQPLSMFGKFLASLYQSITPRTAGSNTLDITQMHHSTLFFIMFLMFIGASPGSTGGGIKTTTFATLMGAVWSQIKGREDIVFFRQRIMPHMIAKSLTVIVSSLFLIAVTTMVLTITEGKIEFIKILFEAVSASSTVGLSMGLTPELTPYGRMMLILTMFAGRVGPLTIAFALAQRKQKEYFRYPQGKIMIG
ncbi:TrkH family potassium uptake protein [Brevibacillus humidisoli]|uniref:TrkH family potassium uptake protein n=1 Tax=Brevibacillus humidisoli TaxID=2895522 RepID=UPI001E336CF3|nr:TrkH family potassium uptake protein [Brevibacillus humidisoli]UFJ39194.1 TrkH family potassium uptake protein [Brevibacillus humidisoli]